MNLSHLLMIVNRDNRLSKDFVPEDLIPIANCEGKVVYTKRLVWDSLSAMIHEARFSYQYLDLTEGYRSYREQEDLFSAAANKYGIYDALRRVSLPGASEHQLGLGVDISNFDFKSKKRYDEEAFKWVHENCARFGFIVRYKAEYSEVTGMKAKPWHLRYVGDLAPKIASLNLPLEELEEAML